MMMRTSARVLLVLLSAAAILPGRTRAAQSAFTLEETTIAEVHAAFRAKRLTCRALVDAYVTRIERLDQRSTLNAIVVVNPAVRQEADALDTRFAASGPTGPLHCVPVIVKDNFETIGLQSAAGSLALQGFISGRDAFQVQRLRAAGALVLAKSNMAEFAFSPYETVNSLRGITRNPYALERVPAGSSGGTAAAVAANFGLVGLGSDTGNSIRGPSAHTALVGIRSTMGLTSRAGVIPLSFLADIAGPMTRTVTDAARVFQVIVGEDPADPVTARSRGRAPVDYMAALSATALRGARLGVLRQAYERTNAPVDPEVVAVFERAIADLRKAGAEVIDPAAVDLTNVRRAQGAGTCRGFKYRHRRVPRDARRQGARPFPRRDHRVPALRLVPGVSPAATHGVAALDAAGPRLGGLSRRPRVSRRLRRGGHRGDGHVATGRLHLSDLEPGAAPHRRGDARQRRGQQSAVLADVRLPRHHGTDGLHARRHAASRADPLRPGLGRGSSLRPGLQLRTGDAASSSASARRPRALASVQTCARALHARHTHHACVTSIDGNLQPGNETVAR